MARTSDAAWRAILAACGAVQGKTLWMSRRTMTQILMDRDQDWDPRAGYFLYGICVQYDDLLPFGEVRLEARRGER